MLKVESIQYQDISIFAKDPEITQLRQSPLITSVLVGISVQPT